MMSNKKSLDMQALWDNAMLNAGSAAWVEALYESYLRNPNDVDHRWH